MAWRNDFEVMGAPEVSEPFVLPEGVQLGGYAAQYAQPQVQDIPASPAKSGMVVDPYMPNEPVIAVDPFGAEPEINRRPTINPTERADPLTVTPPAADPSLAVTPPAGGTPNFGAYSGSASQYVAPQLQPATDKFTTPYYAAYTNDNDLAGAVMVAPGQAIRLVDGKTGEVIFQGQGPEAAQQAVGIANAVSEDKGRKASWSIQADYGPDKGWVAQAAERYDPKKSGIWGTLLDIAAPIILNALLPGLGGALGGALGTFGGRVAFQGLANLGSGLLQGENLKTAATGALGSGLTAGAVGGVLDKFPAVNNLVNKGLTPINNAASDAARMTGLRAALDPLNDGLVNIIDAGGNVIHSVAGGLEAGKAWINNAVDGVVDKVGGLAGPATGAVTTAGGVTTLPLTVTAPTPSVPGLGVPFPSLTPSPNGGFDSSEIIVQGDKPPERPAVPGDATGPVTTTNGVTDLPLTVTAPNPPFVGTPSPFVTTVPPPEVVPTNPDLTELPTSTVPTLPPPPTFPGIPSTGGQTTGGKYGINSNAGTRASLSPIFSGSLPAPTFGVRAPRQVSVDQRYAIEHPEASFFSHVPQAQGPSSFAVPTPTEARFAGIGDLNGDGVMDALDQALWRKRYGGQGYKDGGFAVGPGGGRDDMIDAKLSDGEYVIDAETVALLGDGSPEHGARKLDDFRVSLRRDKGRDLVHGKMSRRARDPHDYMRVR